ncbi:MAG: hypothetical protein LBS45_06780 [Synergistaceae bacterium]|jgi:hypothetical protein|nr:hypothetical protein [Synergistaceae bacterium]
MSSNKTRFTVNRRALLAVIAALALFALPAAADDRSDALALLDQRTAIRWGDDNLTWVVHYTDRFVDLWVKSEAARQRMTAAQEDAYRKSFTDELRTNAATAILLSVHAFGQEPLSLAPLSKNIALLDASGKRISPIAFEKKLDGPLSGLMQGLVFFPKQESGDFKIAVKGLTREGETVFSFSGQNAPQAIATAVQGRTSQPSQLSQQKPPVPQTKETIVKIPTAKPAAPITPQPPNSPKNPEPPERAKSAEPAPEIFPPAAPNVPAAPELAPPVILYPSDDEKIQEPQQTQTRSTSNAARAEALDSYLRAWINGDVDRMYSLLSSESQGRISRELFTREILSDGFRKGLKEGYKVNWQGDSAQVTVSRRLLFMKTLDSKRINFVEENGLNRVSW